jgi:hypothetical protein
MPISECCRVVLADRLWVELVVSSEELSRWFESALVCRVIAVISGSGSEAGLPCLDCFGAALLEMTRRLFRAWK